MRLASSHPLKVKPAFSTASRTADSSTLPVTVRVLADALAFADVMPGQDFLFTCISKQLRQQFLFLFHILSFMIYRAAKVLQPTGAHNH